MRRFMILLATPLRLLWRALGRPVYWRLFGRYFTAIIERLNAALGELHRQEGELTELRRINADLQDRVNSLLVQRMDTTALARRLTRIEDHLPDAVRPQARATDQATHPEEEGAGGMEAAESQAAQT
jgi:hypothetical protein